MLSLSCLKYHTSILELVNSVHTCLIYEKRRSTNIAKGNTRREKKKGQSKKKQLASALIELNAMRDELKKLQDDKDSELNALRDDISQLQQNETNLENRFQLQLKQYQDEFKKLQDERDSELNAMRDAHKNLQDEKDSELNTMRDELKKLQDERDVELNAPGQHSRNLLQAQRELDEVKKSQDLREEIFNQLKDKFQEAVECSKNEQIEFISLHENKLTCLQTQNTLLLRKISYFIMRFSCTICSDPYKFPIMLPCGHLFCMGCCYMSEKVMYVHNREELGKCTLCFNPFDLEKDLRAPNETIGNVALALAVEKSESNECFSYNKWEGNREKSERRWEEIRDTDQQKRLLQWDTLKRQTEDQKNKMMVLLRDDYPEVLVMLRDVEVESSEDNTDSDVEYDDDEGNGEIINPPGRSMRMAVKYLLHRGILPRFMLSKRNRPITKKRILDRIADLQFTLKDLVSAKSAFQKWKKFFRNANDDIEYAYDDPLFGNATVDEEKMFDSFITSHNPNLIPWQKMDYPDKQRMYDLKNDLRKNWLILDFVPRFTFFEPYEEEHCREIGTNHARKK